MFSTFMKFLSRWHLQFMICQPADVRQIACLTWALNRRSAKSLRRDLVKFCDSTGTFSIFSQCKIGLFGFRSLIWGDIGHRTPQIIPKGHPLCPDPAGPAGPAGPGSPIHNGTPCSLLPPGPWASDALPRSSWEIRSLGVSQMCGDAWRWEMGVVKGCR